MTSFNKTDNSNDSSADCFNNDISYHKDGTPYSKRFQEIIFDAKTGYQQNNEAFIKDNEIGKLFSQAEQTITIAETSFAVGLNFLLTLQAYQKSQGKTSKKLPKLQFISFEKYPLTKAHLIKSLAIVSQLSNLSDLLTAQYPAEPVASTTVVPNTFEASFFNGQVKLKVIFKEAALGLSQFKKDNPLLVDIWYLTGFSPTRNPEMWNKELFKEIARLSKSQARLTTTIATSLIEKGLMNVGFRTKNTGLQKKKANLIHAIFQQDPNTNKGYQLRSNIEKPQHVSIIGGGIASACLAYALTKQGVTVTLYCKDTTLAQGGSSNAIGALYPLLHQQKDDISLFYQQAFWRAKALYQEVADQGFHFEHDWCGLLEVSYKEALTKRQQIFEQLNTWPKELIHSVNQQQANNVAGIEVSHGGLFMPNAGWAYPADLVNKLFDAAKATSLLHIKTQTKITKVIQNQTTKAWQLLSDKHSFDANVLVICAGADAIKIEQVKALPLTATRGQVTSMKSNKVSKNIATVICHKGYLTPENNGQHCIGATFQKNNTSIIPVVEDDDYNLNMLNKCLPELTESIDWQKKDIAASKARLRCMSQDHLPLVGAMPDIEQHVQQYAHLAKDKNWHYKQAAPHVENLYVFLGLGARGLCSAPLAADILTAELCGTAYPVDNDMLFNLSPNRFVIRDIIKRKIK